MKLFNKETQVGFLVLIGVVLFYFGYSYLRNFENQKKRKTYQIFYTDVNRLTVSNPVYFSGLSVGKVVDIKIMQPNQENQKNESKVPKVLVKITVDANIPIYEDTYAFLVESDLLGNRAINLIGPPLVVKKKLLKQGDTIQGATEQSFKQLVVDNTLPILSNIKHITDGLNKLIDGFSIEKPQMELMTKNLYRFTNNVAEISRRIKNIIAELNAEHVLIEILCNINNLLNKLDSVDIQQSVKTLNILLNKIQQLMAEENQYESTVGMLINNRDLYLKVYDTLSSLNVLLKDLQVNPKRYVNFSIFGKNDSKNKIAKEKKAQRVKK